MPSTTQNYTLRSPSSINNRRRVFPPPVRIGIHVGQQGYLRKYVLEHVVSDIAIFLTYVTPILWSNLAVVVTNYRQYLAPRNIRWLQTNSFKIERSVFN